MDKMIYIRYVTELFWTNDQYLKGILKMKKKILIIVIIIAAVSATGIWLMSRPELLANMSNSYSKQMTTNSDISFSGKAGDRIKFSFRSDIVSGDLNMVLYDSAGNKIDTLDRAKASETFLLWSIQIHILLQLNVINLLENIRFLFTGCRIKPLCPVQKFQIQRFGIGSGDHRTDSVHAESVLWRFQPNGRRCVLLF